MKAKPDQRPELPVTVRPATARDGDRLFEWANDPVTGAASFRGDRIQPASHWSWFARRLAEPERGRIWIGRRGRHAIGVFRVDLDPDGVLVVSIALDPGQRGRGRSRPLLEAGLVAARDAFPGCAFRAWIRADNEPSLALFRGAGFVPQARQPEMIPPGSPPDAVVLERD